MTSPSATYVRLAAAGVIAFLVAALQAAPATAAPTEPLHAAVSISARVLYPSDDTNPGPTGTSQGAPADAGPAPALLRVRVDVTNVGDEPLEDFHFYDFRVSNGVQDGFQCDLDPTETWIDEPGFALDPGRSITCTETYSEIKQGTLHESIRSVGAVGRSTQEGVTETAHVWAEAGPPAPPSTPPPPASIGHRVWLDTNRNKQWDEGEPGIPGVHMSLRLAFREPQPGPDLIDEETTTDEHGIYHFDDVKPGVRYTVLLDQRAPGLKDMEISSSPFNFGGWGETWMGADTSRSIYTYDAMNFGFVPKDRLAIDIDAPRTATAGTTVDVRAHLYLPAKPGVGWDYLVTLEFRAGGTKTWTKVADANDFGGDRHVKVKVTRSGWFRFRSPGNDHVAPGVSPEAHVTVRTAPVALTAAAPATARPGAPLTVTGTITRAGTPFRTGRITLEHTSDTTTWTTVADVRSTDGTLTSTVQPAQTGSYRYRYAGDSTTAPGTSPAQHVTVNLAIRRSPSPGRPAR